MPFKIVDFAGKETRACVVFVYRGYEISCTTIPRRPEIAVINDATGYWNDRFACTAQGFKEAMEHIDSLIAQENAQ